MKNIKNNVTPTNATLDALKLEVSARMDDVLRHLEAFNRFMSSNPAHAGKSSVSDLLKESGVYQKGLKKALKILNNAAAVLYYTESESVAAVLTAGEIPAYTIAEEDGVAVLAPVKVRPTCEGLEPFTGFDLAARAAALRRCAAYDALEHDTDGRSSILTGVDSIDKDGKPCKKGAPSKAEAQYIPAPKEISKGWLKKHLGGLLSALVGREVVVTSGILRDFESFCVRRSAWGVRSMASASVGGDLVLEYAHMMLAGNGRFKVSVEE